MPRARGRFGRNKCLTNSCNLTSQIVTFYASTAQKLPVRYAVELGVIPHKDLEVYESKELEFKFKKPSSKDEYLAALYEEISENEKSSIGDRTLKTYVYEILERQRKADLKYERETEQKNFNLSWSLGVLAFVALVLIIRPCK